jgi:CubicO group peptidase (beta-lactamase class C family)
VLLASCTPAVPRLSSADVEAVIAEAQTLIAQMDIPAAAVVVITPDDTTIRYFGGLTGTDRLVLASAGKPILADWVAQQVAAGHVRWDESLAELSPDLVLGDYAQITLRQAIDQTSGVLRDDWLWLGRGLNREQAATALRQSAWQSTPGSTFTYNNLVFALAVGRVTARAGLPGDWFGSPSVTSSLRQLDGGLRPAPLIDQNRGWDTYTVGISAVTPALGAFLRTALTADLSHPEIPAENARQTCCPLGRDIRYGLGWFSEEYAGARLYSHVGEGVGWTAVIQLDPRAQVAVAVIVPVDHAGHFVHAIRYAAVARARNLPTASALLLDAYRRERERWQVLANSLTAPDATFAAWLGSYDPEVILAVGEDSIVLQRGGYAWALRQIGLDQLVFIEGPLIGQVLSLACVDGTASLGVESAVLARRAGCP